MVLRECIQSSFHLRDSILNAIMLAYFMVSDNPECSAMLCYHCIWVTVYLGADPSGCAV